MKNIFTTAFMLACTILSAQDTLCTMLTLDEVIYFDYATSEVINRVDYEGDFQLRVNEGEVLCLHFLDEKKRFREVTTTFSDGEHIHNTFNTKDNVIFTQKGWGTLTIDISEARRRK